MGTTNTTATNQENELKSFQNNEHTATGSDMNENSIVCESEKRPDEEAESQHDSNGIISSQVTTEIQNRSIECVSVYNQIQEINCW
jgi:hypothetical protein